MEVEVILNLRVAHMTKQQIRLLLKTACESNAKQQTFCSHCNAKNNKEQEGCFIPVEDS